MGREHFAVGIDVDALAFGLLEEGFHILQVVTGDDDERSFFDGKGNRRRNGSTVSRRVGFIEEGHAGQVDFTRFHDDGQQFVHTPVFAQGREAFDEEGTQFVTGFAEHQGMISIGGHAAHTEENERFQGTDVFIGIPQAAHVVVVSRGIRKRCRFSMDFVDHNLGRFRIEVDVGNGREQAFEDDPVGLCRRNGRLTGTGETDEGSGQLVLKSGFCRRFPADTGTARTACTESRLFTLEAKHLLFFCH